MNLYYINILFCLFCGCTIIFAAACGSNYICFFFHLQYHHALSETFDLVHVSMAIICFSTSLVYYLQCLSIKQQGRFLWRFHFQVTTQRGSKGNGWAQQTHLSSLLSYLAGERWWYPFPPSNVFAFTADAKCQHAASWQSFFIWGK